MRNPGIGIHLFERAHIQAKILVRTAPMESQPSSMPYNNFQSGMSQKSIGSGIQTSSFQSLERWRSSKQMETAPRRQRISVHKDDLDNYSYRCALAIWTIDATAIPTACSRISLRLYPPLPATVKSLLNLRETGNSSSRQAPTRCRAQNFDWLYALCNRHKPLRYGRFNGNRTDDCPAFPS